MLLWNNWCKSFRKTKFKHYLLFLLSPIIRGSWCCSSFFMLTLLLKFRFILFHRFVWYIWHFSWFWCFSFRLAKNIEWCPLMNFTYILFLLWSISCYNRSILFSLLLFLTILHLYCSILKYFFNSFIYNMII